MIPNIFENDFFTLSSLIDTINKAPFTPRRLESLYDISGVNTIDAFIEQSKDIQQLISVGPRGAPAQPAAHAKRAGVSFRAVQMKTEDRVSADEINGLRAFGQEQALMTAQQIVEQRLAAMRNNLEYSLENERVRALMGQYTDAQGNLKSLYTAFDTAQTTLSFALATATTEIRSKCLKTLEAVEDALGAASADSVRVFCGRTFWEQLIVHPKVTDYYRNTQYVVDMRGDPRDEFRFNNITFERYRGTADVRIPDAEAYAVPEGVPGMFIARYAPANIIDLPDQYRAFGQPAYAQMIRGDRNQEITLEAQSNPLTLCTRPEAVIKLTA